MAVDVRLPQEGMSMQEGTILKWMTTVGETVAKGDSMVEVETDKVTFEVEAPVAGTVTELLVEPGDVVPVRDVIARIEPAAG
ncbi:MAG: HlyD family efflux transporter periplasmic adaptor subunit [Actinobacteria bacterium]|nr:HlyD family efflux transporter periplasmic adaptor subunit [Actinomycetota bacterium]